MNASTPRRPPHAAMFLASVVVSSAGALAAPAIAQERVALQANVASPYAAAVTAPAARVDSPLKNLQTPVLRTIAPDAPPAALVLPEHRTVVDQMLQSHEFTFGSNRKAANFAGGSRPPSGTSMDLDAVKLRVSRDKVIIKAEWTFN